ncbi:MAG: alpha/beta fold hydrolase, partial [Myxococcales bacterium]|nr:alpha/beta fold hydrolase [Myxococcales bacterium]
GASVPSRVGLVLVGAGPGAYLLGAAAVVLVNTLLAVAPVRLAHQRPSIADDERAVSLTTRDGYAIEGTATRGADGAGAVLLVHGVADGRDRWLPWVARLRAMRLHVLRIDVRGHGRSDGGFVTYGQRETADVDAALAWLRGQPGVDREHVVMVGTSMGGGTVLAASRDAPVVAAIALAPASSYPRLVAQRTAFLGPLAPFVLNGSAHLARALGQIPMTDWRPTDRMSRTLPFLVAHGTDDGTIPITLSRELAATRPNVSLYELGCGHDDIPAATAADAHWPRMRAFLAAHGLDDR